MIFCFQEEEAELVDPAGVPLPQPAQMSPGVACGSGRAIALLIGRCLGGMLGVHLCLQKRQDTAYWMKTPLLVMV